MRDEQLRRLLTESYFSLLRSPFVLQIERSVDHRQDLLIRERLQHEHPAPRQQRARQLEGRILGRRADERDDAVLDPGEKRVLLRLVEAMDLVAEEDRTLPLILQPLLGLSDNFAHSRDAFGHRGKRLEVPVGVIRDDLGERGFAGPRWAPEDARSQVAPTDQITERFPRTEEVLLTEELLERLGAHARSERLGGTFEKRGLGHDSPSTRVFVRKNNAVPAKNAAGIVHPCLPWSSGTRFDAAT